MYHWIRATVARRNSCPRRGSVPTASLPILLFIWGLLAWVPLRAEAQVFKITQIANFSVLVGTRISLTVNLTNTTGASSSLFWSLTSPGTDATLSPTSTPGPAGPTTFSWTPVQTQSVTFSIAVSQPGASPPNIDSMFFTVTVTNNVIPPTTVPYLALPFTQTNLTAGATLSFLAFATNRDGTSNPLTFDLDAGSKALGATMTNSTPTNGLFTWTPSSAQAGVQNMQVIVSEQNTSLSNTQSFAVTVTLSNNCPGLADILAAVARGETNIVIGGNCPTIVLTNTIAISNSLTLDAGTNNTTITGNNLVQLFTVLPGATFTLRGLTLSGGQAVNGGGLYVSAGATVTLTNCIFMGNSAVGPKGVTGSTGNNGGNGGTGFQASGGAIYNLGDLRIYNSSFLTNTSAGGSGGDGGSATKDGGNGGNGGPGSPGFGGAICNLGTNLMRDCTFSGNTAFGGTGGTGGTNGGGAFPGDPGQGGAGGWADGAAVYSAQSLTAINCTFNANAAQSGNSVGGGTNPSSGSGFNGPRGPDGFGGAVCVIGLGALTNCTFATNVVVGGRGGDGGDAYPIGVHISGNGGDGGNGFGGGLVNSGVIVVVNCTFAGCAAVGGTNGVGGLSTIPGKAGTAGQGLGGEVANVSGTFLLQNSILAASLAGINAYDFNTSRITEGGYNVSSDASPLYLGATSRRNTDPKISSLAANGGPTQTFALQTNSPAIDAIPPALAPTTDQRGVVHPQGTNSDVGAYELVVPPLPVRTTVSISLSAGTGVSINFTGQAGLNYELEYKNALTDSSWILLPPVVPGASGLMVLQDTNTPVASRYYRVLRN